MELGERLRQARLEAGLSQRQLCENTITRNMLSQIENGSARPSMDTLRILAARLGKPMGYFLEDQAVLSSNLGVMAQAKSATGQAVLDALKNYQGPDEIFDAERWLMEALTCLELAQKALEEGKKGYAAALLEQAEKAGNHTPYYTPELERRNRLLCFESGMLPANQLTPDQQEMRTLARAALEDNNAEACCHLLSLVNVHDEAWHFLQGMAYLQMQQFSKAIEHLLQAEPSNPVYGALEQCYRELEDFKQAYFYACKQR